MKNPEDLPLSQTHTAAWVFQTWAAFVLSTLGMTLGIIYLPVNIWVKSYLGMGLAFTVSSTISLSKTVRDEHEAKRILSKVEEARVEKLLAEHHPLR